MQIDMDLERMFSLDSKIGKLREVTECFFSLTSLPGKMWLQFLGHITCLKYFVTRVWLRMCPLQGQLKEYQSLVLDDQCMQLERLHDKVSDSNKRIPKLFMIPKFHKRPYKYRFIAGASNATTKRLAIDVNLCLKLIKKNPQRLL